MGSILSSSSSHSHTLDMSGPVATFVREAIAKDMVVIFSKSYCPYCTMAKKVSVKVQDDLRTHPMTPVLLQEFEKLGQKFTAIEIENRADCDEIQGVLGEMTGAKSVPRVFVKGNFIGGGTDVQKLAKSGELQRMLN